MIALPLTSLTTLLVVLLMFWTSMNVGRARGKYGIKAPATTGHEKFECAFRVQMNTLEWAAMMLPSLWVYGYFLGDRGAAAIGAVWLIGRMMYAIGYMDEPRKRGAGFGIAFFATLALVLGGFWGLGCKLLG
jgi:hypothetical protein